LPAEADAAAKVAAAFEAGYGRRPDGVWAAPGRVNLIGEHVDYNAGLCLPLALPHRTFVALGARDDDVVQVRSTQLGSPEESARSGSPDGDPTGDGWQMALADVAPGRVPGWAGYAVGVPWALRRAGHRVPGFDAVLDGYVPLGSGLSSSAALECAVAIALDDVAGLELAGSDAGRAALAAACVRAENEIAGAPTGGLDQAAALRCPAGRALLLDCRDFTVRQVPLDLPAAGLELLVIDTRAHHALVDGQYGTRREACERACRLLGTRSLRDVAPSGLDDALVRLAAAEPDPDRAGELGRRVRHVVTEIARVAQLAALLDAGRVVEIGPLLDASHASLRDDYEVSCPELDLVCRTAREAGALGARMTGGGFGGSAVALVPAEAATSVATAVAAAFAAAGFDPPGFLHAVPSGPAARVVSARAGTGTAPGRHVR
jgi:galactokinase